MPDLLDLLDLPIGLRLDVAQHIYDRLLGKRRSRPAGMISKDEAKYRPQDTPGERCGLCSMFRSAFPGSSVGSCTLVRGDIAAEMTCDYFDAARPSFGKGVAPSGPISASSVDRVRIYVYNAQGKLLALRRRKHDDENHNPPGTWEMIQGKVETDEGETPELAAMRELGEETGYTMADLESWKALTPYVYEARLKPSVRRQPDIKHNPDQEHETFAWVDPKIGLQWMGRRIAKQAPVEGIERIIRSINWDDWSGLTRLIAPELGEAASEGVLQGMGDLDVDDDEGFALANADAVEYATRRAGDLIDPITQTTKDGIRRLVSQALVDGWSGDQLRQEIENSYLFGPDRAQRIADTELAMATSQGHLSAWRRSGVVRGKQWLVSNDHDDDDVCDENAAAGVIPLDQDFPSGDDGPPAHPNCQCAVVPVVNEEDVGKVTREEYAELARLGVRVVRKYSPDQERDYHGRFGAGGGPEPGHIMSDDEVRDGVTRALKGREDRATHGYTRKTAFVLMPNGDIHQWDQAPWGKGELIGGTSVHSHMGVNADWRTRTEIDDSFSTGAKGDIGSFVKAARTEGIRKDVVLTSSKTMDVLEIPTTADPQVFARGSVARAMPEIPYEERAKAWNERHVSGGELYRQQIRDFATKYRLVYRENVPWTPPPATRRVGKFLAKRYETIADLPASQVQNMTEHEKEIFRSAWNAAFDEYHDEGKAFATAHAAINKYREGRS